MKGFISINKTRTINIEISKSIFIAYLYPIETEDEALLRLQSLRKEHFKATHHCYGYILKSDSSIKKFSDDGEPSGTAGRPILHVLETQNLTNIMIVVVRYFGGVKLGTGGLVRAYSQAASDIIAASELVDYIPCDELLLVIDYPEYNRLQSILNQPDIKIEKTIFEEKVTIDILISQEDKKRWINEVTDILHGIVDIKCIGQKYWQREITKV